MRTQINQNLEESGERERSIGCTGAWNYNIPLALYKGWSYKLPLVVLHSGVQCLLHCRLKELLRARLKECGWRDQLKEHCRGSLSLFHPRCPLC